MWSRRPDERPRQWRAFNRYLTLLYSGLDHEAALEELAKITGSKLNTLRRYAEKHEWRLRGLAFMRYVSTALHEEAIASLVQRHLHIAHQLQALGMGAIIEAAELGEIRAADALKMVQRGVEIERDTLGQVTIEHEVVRLSDDELESALQYMERLLRRTTIPRGMLPIGTEVENTANQPLDQGGVDTAAKRDR